MGEFAEQKEFSPRTSGTETTDLRKPFDRRGEDVD
jgi:hypothetical protein